MDRNVSLAQLRTTPRVGGFSLWGEIQHLDVIIPGRLYFASTAGHEGYWLCDELLAKLPLVARCTKHSRGGWFEGDVDAAIPFAFLDLGEAVKPAGVARAREMILADDWYLPEIRTALMRAPVRV